MYKAMKPISFFTVIIIINTPSPRFKMLLKWQRLEIKTRQEILGYCFAAHDKA